MRPLTSNRAEALSGETRPPGDKSISHRALMLGAVAAGESVVHGLLEGEDILATAAALRALGAGIERGENGAWYIEGRGVGGLHEPEGVLDLGNSGTGARLLMGLVASHPMQALFTGDASLRTRPMQRVIGPLSDMGATFVAREGGRLPLALVGTADPVPLDIRLEVASAQVKSAILLAALNTPGKTIIREPRPTRDHTERMLADFGAEIVCEGGGDGGTIALAGCPELVGQEIRVPGDPSSAAFPAVAALIVPGSKVRLKGVGTNPLRTGLYRSLEEMGAEISFDAVEQAGGEPAADISVRAGPLKGVEVPADRAPAMIDEYPILAVAAACAEGRTVFNGIGELRVKESDRLAAIADGLSQCGVEVEAGDDTLVIHGTGAPPAGPPDGAPAIETRRDHRIAMAFLVLGMVTDRPVSVDDGATIETSFPGFAALMNELGADIGPTGPDGPDGPDHRDGRAR